MPAASAPAASPSKPEALAPTATSPAAAKPVAASPCFPLPRATATSHPLAPQLAELQPMTSCTTDGEGSAPPALHQLLG